MIFTSNKSQICNTGFFLLSLYSVLLTTVFCHTAQCVEVHGTFSIETYWPEGVTNRSDREFSVNIDDQKWEITTMFAHPTNGVKYYQSTFDGTNVFSFTAFDTNYNKGTTNKPSKNDSLGFVRTESYPPYDSSLTQPIWLALCSASYLSQFSNSPAPSFLGIGYPNTPLRFCKVHVATFDERSKTPSSIQISNEGKIVLSRVNPGGMNTAIDTILTNAPAPYNKGFLSAEYKAIEQTNFNGVLLPLRFQIDVFSMKANATSASDLRVSTRFLGCVKEIQTGESPKLQPELGRRSLVFDNRVKTGSNSVAVYWASNKWLSHKEAEQMVSKNNNHAKSEPKRRTFLFVFGILAVAGLASIFVFFANSKRSDSK